MRLLLVLSVLGGVLSASASQADLARHANRPLQAPRLAQTQATGDEVLPELAVKQPILPAPRTDITAQVGSTAYDYQGNGSLSKMIAVSSDGVAHGSFMYSLATDHTWADRRVKSWCVNPDLSIIEALNVYDARAGYTTAACMGPEGETPNSTVVAFHTSTDSWLGTDFMGCTHAFNLLQSNTLMLWPHVGVDGDNRQHMVSYDSANPHVWYRGTSDGASWDGAPIRLTSDSQALGAIAVGSKISSRAAVLFHQRTDAEDIPYDGGSGVIGVQIHHDILGYVANDGDIFGQYEAGAVHNFTDYGPDSEVPFGPYGNRAYCDIDGLFDRTESNDLHVVYSGDPMWTDTLHVIWNTENADSLQEIYYHWTLGRGQIWHFNADHGEWSHVTGHNSIIDPNDRWLDGGAWRMRQDRPSLAVDPETGYLYCAWNQRIEGDRAAPGEWGCTTPVLDSIGNAEIFIACSADNGLTWGEPVNVTNTHTPGCVNDCLSEDWMSMAEVVSEGNLHLAYVEDHSTGGVAQCEGNAVINPIMYMRVPVADIPPHTGTPWDAAGWVGLAQTQRWYGWYSTAWCGDEAVLDSVKWVDPIHLLNESPMDVQLSHISWHHSSLDQIGTPEEQGITEVGLEVKTDAGYVPINEWTGLLPAWRGTKFNAHFAYAGLTNYDVLIGFHFADERPSLYYRMEMVNALQGDETEPCTGVVEIPWENVDQMEETVLFDFEDELPPAQRPVEFGLLQASPNPFNPSTQLRYSLDTAGRVSLRVYNVAGQWVATLDEGFRGAGWHQARFDGAGLASGVYVCTLEAGGRTVSQKLLLSK